MAEPGRAPGGKQGFAGPWPPRTATPAGGFVPAGLGSWPPLVAKLREWVRAEAGAGRLLPWVPVAFGTGIAFYFAADHEPVLSVAATLAVALCAVALLLLRQKFFAAAGVIAAVAAGFCPPAWKTPPVSPGVLARPVFFV